MRGGDVAEEYSYASAGAHPAGTEPLRIAILEIGAGGNVTTIRNLAEGMTSKLGGATLLDLFLLRCAPCFTPCLLHFGSILLCVRTSLDLSGLGARPTLIRVRLHACLPSSLPRLHVLWAVFGSFSIGQPGAPAGG